MIRFDVNTNREFRLIEKIAHRAIKMIDGYQETDARMDITACHLNGCPLRLADLLAADDANFGHDVFGIRRFLDRKTGKLGGCFNPHYAQREGIPA